MLKHGNYTCLGASHFFEVFSKKRIFFSKSDFNYKLDTKKRKISVDRKLYRQITKKFYRIYFSELYYQNKPKYFFLSGMIEKVKLKGFFCYIHEQMRNPGIGFVWYNRPSFSYLININMIKLTKSTFDLREIELRYRPHCDYEKLKPLNQLLKELTLGNKKYY